MYIKNTFEGICFLVMLLFFEHMLLFLEQHIFPKSLGPMGPWAQGPKGPRAHGPKGPRAQGPRGPWAQGPFWEGRGLQSTAPVSKIKLLGTIGTINRINRIIRKRWQQLRLRPSPPHAPGARMTAVVNNSLKSSSDPDLNAK